MDSSPNSGQGNNPFAEKWDAVSGKEGYGRPPEGSLTEARGIKAHIHVHKEIVQLCDIIRSHGEEVEDGYVIFFGPLFRMYISISNKVVGILLRARKQGFVDFEGEMLFQGRDDKVPILLRRHPRDTNVVRK